MECFLIAQFPNYGALLLPLLTFLAKKVFDGPGLLAVAVGGERYEIVHGRIGDSLIGDLEH
jgi:hypothetical protein